MNKFSKIAIAFSIIFFGVLFFAKDSLAATVYFQETFSDGNLSPYTLQGGADPCSCDGDSPTVNTSDYRPGSSDSYAFNVTPQLHDIACCVYGWDQFLAPKNTELWWTFWFKWGGSNRFDSGNGKGPEIDGGTVSGRSGFRIVVPNGLYSPYGDAFIPHPPDMGGYYIATYPAWYVETSIDAGSGWGWNSCDASGRLGTSWGQNIFGHTFTYSWGTSQYAYLERGHWYGIKVYVLLKTLGGRYRMWIKPENESSEVEIMDTNLMTNCPTKLQTVSSATNAAPRRTELSVNYNDHGGGGANAGFKYWVDDIWIGDYNPSDSGDTTPPAAPTGVTIQ